MSENIPVSDSNHTEPRRRPWLRLTLIGPVLVGAVLAAVVLFQENVSPTEATADDPLNFAEVVITDLVQEETLNGDLGHQLSHQPGQAPSVAPPGPLAAAPAPRPCRP
jgi:hypothetical protein